MKVFRDISEFRDWRRSLRKDEAVGFVPTMGALHQGHLHLMSTAQESCSLTVASIFVNPTQFNNPEDLAKYPRTLEKDLGLLESVGVTAVVLPTVGDLYPDGYRYKVTENKESLILCGAHRPGHFDGVLTVVLKLLNLVQPQIAFFGEKDFQQLRLIQKMVESIFLPVEIRPVATVREADGLAMSSRNMRLSTQERELAPQIYKILKSKMSKDEAVQKLESLGFRVDYLEEYWGRRLVAAHLGSVRLIDNVELS